MLATAPAAAFTVGELRRLVCAHAAGFDAQVLDRDGAVQAIEEWSRIVHAADAALAMATARLARLGPPSSAGAASAAEFVAKTTGTTTAKATEKIKTGEGLHANDRTRAEAVAGALSGEQTAAITDAIAVNPDAEDKLLGLAPTSSLGGLRDECARSKAEGQDLADVERRIRARRALRRWQDAEGVAHLHAAGTKDTMVRVDQALKPIIDEIFNTARTGGVREPFEAYAYDALVTLADRSLDHTSSPRPTDTATSDPTPPRKRTGGSPTICNLAVLRLDLTALTRGHPEGSETCEIVGLGPISVETARAMLGESILKLVITKGVDVHNVTHLGRGPNTAQKIALLWQQPECTRQGCNRTARLEYNHAYGVEYHKTKHTRVDETEPTCDPDHDLITYHGWAYIHGKGKRPLVPPDDPRHPKHTKPPP